MYVCMYVRVCACVCVCVCVYVCMSYMCSCNFVHTSDCTNSNYKLHYVINCCRFSFLFKKIFQFIIKSIFLIMKYLKNI